MNEPAPPEDRQARMMWVLHRLYLLQQAGLIEPDGDTPIGLNAKGVVYAEELIAKYGRPSEQDVLQICGWLFRTKIPTPPDVAAKLVYLILEWQPPKRTH